MSNLDVDIYTKEKIFNEKLKVEKFIVDPSTNSVVCSHCMSNCGQCGISNRLGILNKEYKDLQQEKKLVELTYSNSIITFLISSCTVVILIFALYILGLYVF